MIKKCLMELDVNLTRTYSFHKNDNMPSQPFMTKLSIPVSMLLDYDEACYNDPRCEAVSWTKVGYREKEGFRSDVLQCSHCKSLMLRHVVRE